MAKKKITNSFRSALRGLFSIVKKERNLKIHLIALGFVCIAGYYFSITKLEWLSIFTISALVISLEIINSSIEKLSDFSEPNYNEKIKIIKDTAASAVLVAAAFAIMIGGIIFLPYFLG
jgi:diacylglycerol kinase